MSRFPQLTSALPLTWHSGAGQSTSFGGQAEARASNEFDDCLGPSSCQGLGPYLLKSSWQSTLAMSLMMSLSGHSPDTSVMLTTKRQTACMISMRFFFLCCAQATMGWCQHAQSTRRVVLRVCGLGIARESNPIRVPGRHCFPTGSPHSHCHGHRGPCPYCDLCGSAMWPPTFTQVGMLSS